MVRCSVRWPVCAAFALALATVSWGDASPYCPALGRELSWDPFGLYPLDVERPLTKTSAKIVNLLNDAELGRAESIARHALLTDGNDFVPAWALAQIVRVRHSGLAEYRRIGEKEVTASGPVPLMLYRFHVCRIAKDEVLNAPKIDQELYRKLDRQMAALRDRCRSATNGDLGLAIGLTQRVSMFWAPDGRAILEEYRRAHPNGVDVRPLLCAAYSTGVNYGPVVIKGKRVEMSLPDAPKPKKVLEVAQSILRDRPNDPLGLFYVARAQFYMKNQAAALQTFKAALNSGKLLTAYKTAARRFIDKPERSAFNLSVKY